MHQFYCKMQVFGNQCVAEMRFPRNGESQIGKRLDASMLLCIVESYGIVWSRMVRIVWNDLVWNYIVLCGIALCGLACQTTQCNASHQCLCMMSVMALGNLCLAALYCCSTACILFTALLEQIIS